MLKRSIFAIAVLFAFSLSAVAQRAHIAILDFDYIGNSSSKAKVTKLVKMGIQHYINQSKKYVVQTRNFDAIIKEHKLQIESGLIDTRSVQEVGKAVGVPYVAYGKIIKVSDSEHFVNCNIVNVKRGVIVASSIHRASAMSAQAFKNTTEKIVNSLFSTMNQSDGNEQKIAVLEFSHDKSISTEAKLLQLALRTLLAQSGRYSIVERDLESIKSELNFQHTSGMIDSSKVVEAGKIWGVKYVVHGSVETLGGEYMVSCNTIDIETAALYGDSGLETSKDMSIDSVITISQKLVKSLIGNQKLGKGEYAGQRKFFSILPGSKPFGMRWIPPGKFKMGSSEGPQQLAKRYGGSSTWYEHEGPRHDVRISEGYWMMETEVPIALFAYYMLDTKSSAGILLTNAYSPLKIENGILQLSGGNMGHTNWQAIANVSWEGADMFAKWLSQKTGYNFRLPTEAQWEYAARAGSTGPFYWGSDINDDTVKKYACYIKNSHSSQWTYPHAKYWGPQVTGSKLPNAWGLYDMSGNVWEWCADWFSPYPAGPVTDPRGPKSGSHKVIRGGSWVNIPGLIRPAARQKGSTDYAHYAVGFRLIATDE